MPSIDDLRKITSESKDSFEKVFTEAVDKAFDEIVKNYYDKMRDSAQKNRTRAYLYTWSYVEDKQDKTGTFNNIRMLDLLTKGGETPHQGLLSQKLREFFNPNRDPTGYYVGFHKFKNREPTQYGIYVSWYKKPAGETDGSVEKEEQ